MKKFFIVFLLVQVSLYAYSINPPSKVVAFYNGLENLQYASDNDEAYSIQMKMADCFMASDMSGINLKVDGLDEMSSNLYTMQLFNLIYCEKKLKTACQIYKTEIVEQPDITRSLQQKDAQHYATYVKKNYTQDGKTKSYNDIVITYIQNGYIVEMENTQSFDNVPPSNRTQLTIDQLRARAAYSYSKANYDLAYDYYEKLLSRAPTDGDAAYRIALMTFWRKGCKYKFRNRKSAQTKAKEYLNKAIAYGCSEIKSKAENVLNNWNQRNVYF